MDMKHVVEEKPEREIKPEIKERLKSGNVGLMHIVTTPETSRCEIAEEIFSKARQLVSRLEHEGLKPTKITALRNHVEMNLLERAYDPSSGDLDLRYFYEISTLYLQLSQGTKPATVVGLYVGFAKPPSPYDQPTQQ